MAREVYAFDCVIPAGTAKTAPVTVAMKMPPRVVQELEIRVPRGPRGNVGFAIGSSGQSILPLAAGQYIVTDDEVLNWPLDGFHDSGAWELKGYNIGTYAHTITVRFLCQLVGAGNTSAPIPIDLGSAGVGQSEPAAVIPPAAVVAPPPAVATAPTVIPPIQPGILLPGQGQIAEVFGRRPVRELSAAWGGLEHLLWVDPAGTLQGRHRPVTTPGGAGVDWKAEDLAWATGLAPAGLLMGGVWSGLAHVLAPMQDGTVLHLAQAADGGANSAWGGEILRSNT